MESDSVGSKRVGRRGLGRDGRVDASGWEGENWLRGRNMCNM